MAHYSLGRAPDQEVGQPCPAMCPKHNQIYIALNRCLDDFAVSAASAQCCFRRSLFGEVTLPLSKVLCRFLVHARSQQTAFCDNHLGWFRHGLHYVQ